MINKKEIRRIIKINGAENVYQVAKATMGIYSAHARGVLLSYGLPCNDIGAVNTVRLEAFAKMTEKERAEDLAEMNGEIEITKEEGVKCFTVRVVPVKGGNGLMGVIFSDGWINDVIKVEARDVNTALETALKGVYGDKAFLIEPFASELSGYCATVRVFG